MKKGDNISETKTLCYHCGDDCQGSEIAIEGKHFCCHGCKSVFEILNANDLCTYYNLNDRPGATQKRAYRQDKFLFLENEDIRKKVIRFSDGKQTQVVFYLPQIHCSSCLWLLENLHKINPGIICSKVNFTQKEVFLVFEEQHTGLREVVETLTQIGYEPHLSLSEISSGSIHKINRTRWYKIGVAGFCFGNIMMMSFADYFANSNVLDAKIDFFFKMMSILLSLPVLFYSATEFFSSAWTGLKNKYLNIDLPVALALVITFLRSLYEIYNHSGNGYLDSLSGIVFFMLIGRWLQSRTYQTISFDRDYKSFFPIALNVVKDGNIFPTEVSKVKENDVIQIHHNEILPVDAILSKGTASIDYSFVSGESLPVEAAKGELVYAGGRQTGGIIELVVVKEISQSYLTNLWNNPIFNKTEAPKQNMYDAIAKYFTYAVLLIGFAAGMYWKAKGENTLMWNAMTTVLIVACPCALLLAQNFTYGNILRVFGFNKFYLKSPEVIEKLANVNHIVFDKTGTLTQTEKSRVIYTGKVLENETRQCIASLIAQSSHPASKNISEYLHENQLLEIIDFKETPGKGIEGWIQEKHIKIGSPEFVGGQFSENAVGTKVIVAIDGSLLGEFQISNQYRLGVGKLLQSLKSDYSLSLISGDNASEMKNVEELLGKDSELLFHQTPHQKLGYIQKLQGDMKLNVMMIGDGLNDSGALKQSNVGLAIADGSNSFTPASDCILDAVKFPQLHTFLKFAKEGKFIILITFTISAIYNIIGLYFAVRGELMPVIAAILMPLSSITIIGMTYGLTEIFSWKHKLKS